MRKQTKIKSLIILLTFFMTAFYVSQAPSVVAEPNQGITLKVLVSDQQKPDIEMWASEIVANSGGAISAVTVVASASRSDDQFGLLQTLLTTGDTEFDVIAMDVIWPAGFAENGWLEDLSTEFNQTFRDGIIDAHAEAMVYGGKVVAGPFFFDSGLVLYRKDILERNGLTIDDFETWSDWLTNLNLIMDNDTEVFDLNRNLEGYVFQGDGYEGGIVNLVEWMGASGGSFIDSVTGTGNFADTAEPALTWMKGLIAPIYNGPANNTGNYVSTRSELIGDEGSAVTKWLAGNAVFQRNWPFSQSSSANDAVLNGSQVLKFANGTSYNANVNADPWFTAHPNENRFGVTTLPYNATICGAGNTLGCRSAVLGGAVLGIPVSSTHKAEAKMFLKEIASLDFQLEMAINGTGNTPMLKEVYTGSHLNNTSQEFKNQLFVDVYPNVLPRPVHPKYAEMSKAIQPLYHNGFSGALSVTDALEAMDEQVNLILGLVDTSPTTVTNTATATVTGTVSTKTISTPGMEMIATVLSLVAFGFIYRIRKIKKN